MIPWPRCNQRERLEFEIVVACRYTEMSQICFDRDIFGTSMGIFRTFLQHFRDIFTRKPIRHCGPGFGRRQCLLLFPFNCCLKSELLLPLTLGTMAKFDWYARLRQYDYPIWFTSYKLDYSILGNTQWAFSRIFCTEKMVYISFCKMSSDYYLYYARLIDLKL